MKKAQSKWPSVREQRRQHYHTHCLKHLWTVEKLWMVEIRKEARRCAAMDNLWMIHPELERWRARRYWQSIPQTVRAASALKWRRNNPEKRRMNTKQYNKKAIDELADSYVR